MNKVVIQEGYSLPFDGHRKRRHHKRRTARRLSGGMKRQQTKMKVCAKKWNGNGSYIAHMKRCLKGY